MSFMEAMDRSEQLKNTKIIFITGGVMSGIGKGVVTASIGMLLKTRGFRVKIIKCDPYLNVDPGVQSPYEHGEVFVTEEVYSFELEGNKYNIAELDLDFGHYERFLNTNMHPKQNITSGQIFLKVLSRERKGEYLGDTVQMIPHVTDEIKRRIYSVIDPNEPEDFLLIEIGGTTGDIEGELFLETARQIFRERGREKTMLTHVTWVPFNKPVSEFKTKPTQHSISILYARGLFPDFIICRSDQKIDESAREKIALHSNLRKDHIIQNPHLDTIYRIPILFENQNLCSLILDHFTLSPKNSVRTIVDKLDSWEELVNNIQNLKQTVTIGLGGKYIANSDAYYSIEEALLHAGTAFETQVNIEYIDVEHHNEIERRFITKYDGILIPGGFGRRGAAGKIHLAINCIKEKIPVLGICYGMQLGLVAAARHLCGLKNANSIEVDKDTPHPVIIYVEGQQNIQRYGGTMRLGSYEAHLKKNTLVRDLYGKKTVSERHRHRLEVNPDYIDQLSQCITISGVTTTQPTLVEFIELPPKVHPFFVGTQAHPEFKSRLQQPHALYKGFVQACLTHKKK